VTLAHELQHAVELLEAKNARSPTECEALFARIGFRSGPHSYETHAAVEVDRRVAKELGRW
jgi:hypothetical protein